ncbi:ABC transporter permease [Paraglaciecola aquimarina]|uniref:ABC transporter permease n=1 Tax=Paraglaciecola aquimarina TaxID=1235557 RepID=A0ABU3SRU8_9ALTE|nr:ABC transporter permease [Paraglaciecola aquimarina]MDU0352707.1 ABC transporter permease [Paraglaciecola aquimarina]
MSNFIPLVFDALAEMAAHKLRTLLTLLGMIFGVGAVIAMLNIGEGAEQQALKMIDSMGLRNLIVESKTFADDELKDIRQESLGLTLADVDAARATLPFVEGYSAERHVKTQSVYSDNQSADVAVLGVSASHFELSNMKIEVGRELNEQDNTTVAQVAVLGAGAAQRLFPTGEAIGQYIKVNHLWVEVVGVLNNPFLAKDEFQGVKIGGDGEKVFVPLSTSLKKLNGPALASELDIMKLKISEDTDPMVAAKAVSQLFKLRHGEADDYQIIVPAALLAQQKQTQQIFNIVMACVAGISLLVGGIGIMNIMLANVLERTKEIGLLRAVGATQRNIKMQFIAESFTISVLGGLLGIAFGLILSEVIGFYSGWAVSWSMTAIVLSLTICMAVGIGFGVYPAIKASQLNPIDALHSD